MLNLNFKKESFDDSVYYLINEKFPNINYETKKTKVEVQIKVSTNNFDSILLDSIMKHEAFVDFFYDTLCKKCNEEVNYKEIVCGNCIEKVKECCKCEEEKIAYAKCYLLGKDNIQYFCKECFESLEKQGICKKDCLNLKIIK